MLYSLINEQPETGKSLETRIYHITALKSSFLVCYCDSDFFVLFRLMHIYVKFKSVP